MTVWCSETCVRTESKYRNFRHTFPAVCAAVKCSVCWVNACGQPFPVSIFRNFMVKKEAVSSSESSKANAVISCEAGSSQFCSSVQAVMATQRNTWCSGVVPHLWLQCDNRNGHLEWRPTNIYVRISYLIRWIIFGSEGFCNKSCRQK